MSNKRYRTHYKIYSDLDTFGFDSVCPHGPYGLLDFEIKLHLSIYEL